VNARLVAAERGIHVSVGKEEETSGYKSLLTVAIDARGGRKVVAGTVFDGQPRIVRMRDLKIEFTPEGYILVLAYEDRPGVVGAIGTLLGRRNVNIGAMHVGRRVRRGNAIVVLILDEDLTPEHLEELTRAIGADFARLIRL
jgi:D-3-phosphoglycerate dehydrogenase